ncbi:MAG: hypothetical protein IJU51_05630, partial [Clostridia bacterium]|nr:hypothetical protein [Clostridia bacterium]
GEALSLAHRNSFKSDNTKVLVKLFQKLAGSRGRAPCGRFGGRCPPIFRLFRLSLIKDRLFNLLVYMITVLGRESIV